MFGGLAIRREFRDVGCLFQRVVLDDLGCLLTRDPDRQKAFRMAQWFATGLMMGCLDVLNLRTLAYSMPD